MTAMASSAPFWGVPARNVGRDRLSAGIPGKAAGAARRRGILLGAAAALCLWGVGTLIVADLIAPAVRGPAVGAPRLALRLPVTPLGLNRPPVRPGRFDRLPEIANAERPGLSGQAVVAAHDRLAETALGAAMTATVGRLSAEAATALADAGRLYLPKIAGAFVPAPDAPVEVAALEAPQVLPPTPSPRPRLVEPRRAEPQAPALAPAVRAERGSAVAKAPPAPSVTSPSVSAPRLALAAPAPGVAIYDISAGVVHMPDGSRLEAHSGIGQMRDNPRFVHVKMRGATPPAIYRLSIRESLFHGVKAIRLTPIDGKAPLGRVGLLAHTYMLRTPGDSNGCVVFRNYDRFLKAFQRGEITRMVVVPNLDGNRRQQIAALENS